MTRKEALTLAEIATEEAAMPKTKLRIAIDEFCHENWPDEEILLFGSADGDPYDEGFIGVGFQRHKGPVAVYDREECVKALAEEFAKDGNSDDEDADPYTDAVEFFSFNTEGSWVGEQTPIVVSRFQPAS